MSRTAHKLLSASGGKAYEIDQSLLFEVADTSYLYRNYGGAANSYTKWTFSTWFKNTSENYAGGTIWGVWDSSTQSDITYGWIGVYQDKLQVSGWSTTWRTTNRLFRDVGAWYHIVVAIDTNESTADNRIRIYINGVEETSFATKNNPSTNTQMPWGKANQHRLGAINSSTPYYLGGYLAETQLIDGSQLTPSSFGETDSVTGQWIPKKYAGTYTGYSFYLPFKKNDRYSVYFDDTSNTGITIADSTDWDFGTNDFTVECWIYRNEDAGDQSYIFGQSDYSHGANSGNSVYINVYDQHLSGVAVDASNTNNYVWLYSTADSTTIEDNKWYHVAMVRNGNVFTMYLDGTAIETETQNITINNASSVMGVGKQGIYNDGFWKGWISNFRLVMGTAVYTSNFTPSTSPLTAITNTKLLCCQDADPTVDNSGTGKTLTVTAANTYTQQMSPFQFDWYEDQSGQGIDYQADNLTINNLYLDTPTNNFAVHNSTGSSTATSFTVGNLWGKATSDSFSKIISTIAPTSGKWYCEYYVKGTQHNGSLIGASTRPEGAVVDSSNQNGTNLNDETSWSLQHNTSSYQRIYRSSNVEQENLGNVSVGDILSIAIDADNSKVYFRKNNTIVGSSSGHTINTLQGGDRYFFAFYPRAKSGYTGHGIVNYGQNSSFNGLKIAQGNTDGNGIGDFYYSPPSGFKALCTKNLPTPAIKKSTDHFDTVLYTGNNSNRNITSFNFQPDFLWLKSRESTYWHRLIDAVRGSTRSLHSDNTQVELVDDYGTVGGFLSNGFSLRAGAGSNATHAGTNANGDDMVAWAWKAGGSGSANTDGSINSTVSANTTAGFSIVTWTGDGSTSTVGHGLGVVPKLYIMKRRDSANYWWAGTTAVDGSLDFGELDTTAAFGASSLTVPTSSVFYTDGSQNTNSATYVAYVFAEVEGFSKFGSYEGNGSTAGPYINTGFRPAYIWIKNIVSGKGWTIFDNKRDIDNPTETEIYIHATDAEASPYTNLDILSNGFKVKATSTWVNGNGNTLVYAAFAEAPFKYANAR